MSIHENKKTFFCYVDVDVDEGGKRVFYVLTIVAGASHRERDVDENYKFSWGTCKEYRAEKASS